MTNDKFKKFCKKKCGECGCVAFKRFAKMSPLVVRARVGSLWCQKCGRLLCEAHRNQHSCEMEMEELARRRRVDVDAIREGIKRQEEEKEQRAADADALKRAEAGAKAARYRMWKDRRRHVAGISSSVASMVQRWSVQADAGRKRDRLLDIYTSCNRINLRLWNEVSQPEILSDVDMDAWKRLCRNYADACALTGMVILVEGVELDLRLPWLRDEDQDWLDAPPPDQNEVDLSTADPPS